jgi:nucleoid-associated protein YgaU
MASTVGIKIANGEFYPILEENSVVRKRLILTTVRDNQTGVHIDLYKSNTMTMTGAVCIGSLAVENIKSKLRGEPSLELVISSNQDGEIVADVRDLDPRVSADHQRQLKVSLAPEDNKSPNIPDFELDQPPVSALYERESEKKGSSIPVIILITLLLIGILFALWFFSFGGKTLLMGKENVPAIETPVEPVEPEAQPQEAAPVVVPEATASEPEVEEAPVSPPEPEVSAADEPVVIEAPLSPPPQEEVKRVRPKPPVSSYKVPPVIPPDGVQYKIRWGDTLWDIAEAFYRNPWLYPRIAQFNQIRRPDLIISGTVIRIPPRR